MTFVGEPASLMSTAKSIRPAGKSTIMVPVGKGPLIMHASRWAGGAGEPWTWAQTLEVDHQVCLLLVKEYPLPTATFQGAVPWRVLPLLLAWPCIVKV